MARIDPFCRPESYIDFFGKSTFGVSLDSLVLNQEKILMNQADKESQFAGQIKTMLPWFVAGCVFAIVLNSIIECRKRRVFKLANQVKEKYNYLDTQGLSSISKD